MLASLFARDAAKPSASVRLFGVFALGLAIASAASAQSSSSNSSNSPASSTASKPPPKAAANTSSKSAGGDNRSKDGTEKSKPAQTVKRTGTDRSSGKLIQIAPLNKKNLPATCGCAFYAPTNQRDSGPMWLWLDDKGNAQMQLDGQLQQLTMTSQRMVKRKKDADRLSAGDRVLVTLRSKDAAAGYQASVSSSSERNCTISAKVCSAPTFKSLINLSKGDSRRSLGAWSVCSCPGSSKPYTPSPTATNNVDSKNKKDDSKSTTGAKPAASTKPSTTGGSNPRPAAEKK